MLCGVCCLGVVLVAAFLRRSRKRHNSTNLSSPSPSTDTDAASRSQSAGDAARHSDGSSRSSNERHLSNGMVPWHSHDLEAGGKPVDEDAQRHLDSSSVSSLSERGIYQTASGLLFVHD